MHYNLRKCADALCQKLSKLVRDCQTYSLPKLAYFFETQCSSNKYFIVTVTAKCLFIWLPKCLVLFALEQLNFHFIQFYYG